MTSFLLAGLALCSTLGVSNIEGQVVGQDNRPIAHAQVFLEPGLGGALLDAITSETGHFQFQDVAPGGVGIFATAPGYGFEGRHLTIAVADVVPPLKLTLHKSTAVSGTIETHEGKPVEGARITRIGVKGAHKVGVPLAKLREYGYAEPVSDAGGVFTLEGVPENSLIDLKVGHPNFAQEGYADARAGASGIKITLHRGVLVEGTVIARTNQAAVGQAAVLIQNAQPPHDTATTRAGLNGKFSIRLKPGVYLYQAYGAGLQSSGWERLAVTGERPVEQMRVVVAGTGSIRGNVRDAITGNPVRDVRVTLTTNGTTAAIVRTGPSGDFLFNAGEGENVVRLDATPGYFPPENQDIKVTLLENNAVELPGMWLKPLPVYTVEVLDNGGALVPGALISVLRPRQFGWYVTGNDGTARINVQSFPDDGALLGRIEHPTLPQAALFRMEKNQAGPATVQLFETGAIQGTVVNARGRGIGGASVGAFFPGETADDAILLWQTYSDQNGEFTWNSVVPGIPQRCAARTGSGAAGETVTFNLAPGESKTLGEISVDGGEQGDSQLGTSPRWYSWELLCGALPDPDQCAQSPAVLVFTSADRASVYLESLVRMRELVNKPDLIVALVVDGTPECEDASLPVLGGSQPGSATTLVLDRTGTVVLETSGIPPVGVLNQL